jgi:SAM-dependent methyltransferase
MKKKIEAHRFFDRGYSVDWYSELYKKLRFDIRYPANIKRLEIIINILKKHKPKKIVDAGCGAGMPLIYIKKKGFDIRGYDKSKNMLIEATENLKKNKLPLNLVFQDDFETPKKIKNNSVDCILGMGAFYYSKNFNKTILNQTKKLKHNGRLIFSLRNRLFDLATLNNYSKAFLDEIYKIKYLKKNWKKKYQKLTSNFSHRKKYKFKNIDEEKVHNHIPHNPLIIASEMAKIGLRVEGIYFYHFHALPPVFENFDEQYFRKISWKIENPTDWRGYFLASAFIVDCKKV